MRCSGKGFVWPGSGTRSFRRAGRGCAASCPPATPVRISTSRSRRSGGWEPSSALCRHARLWFSFGFCSRVGCLAPQVLSRLRGLTLWQVWTFCDQLLFWGSLVGRSQPFLDLMAALSPLGRPWEVVAMRVLSMLGTVLACGATALSAQRSHRIELGGFGTYTRYDPIFGLERQFGGGGRLGFFLTNNIGLEVDGSLTRPVPTAGGPSTQVRFGSASLVISSGGPYILGGYSRLDMGVNPPYNFALKAVHGGLGTRIFFTHPGALRIEARAYYPTSNPNYGNKKSLDATASAGLSVLLLCRGGPHAAAPPPLPPGERGAGRVAEAPGTGASAGPAPPPKPPAPPPPAPPPHPAPIPALERRTP